MRGKQALKSTVTTRDRILDAAVLRFSRHSYEETGLRDIAADAGVDVAYVHRCFGSKERLFAQAIEAAVEPKRRLAGRAGDLAATLTNQVFETDDARARGQVAPLDIVIRSLSSPDASRVLRDFILNDFINPLAKKLDQPAGARVALIVAVLVGVGILRNVLCIESLLEAKGGELESLIAKSLEGLMNTTPRTVRA
ncbi:MAG: TetR family transcriptional regulator [Pseudolabrys sp.]|nr:TetR family transcriptional regulator [Pseudolabrys sp.]